MLTAAHCAQTSGIEVILGDHDYSQTGETLLGEKRFSVARAIVHEDYMNYGISCNNLLSEDFALTP